MATFGKVQTGTGTSSNGIGFSNDMAMSLSTPNGIAATAQRKIRASINKPAAERLVVVRYFLDRPGYNDLNSVARPWFDVPVPLVKPIDIQTFVNDHGISAIEELLIEVYIDKFGSYMSLQACEDTEIEWDFSDTTKDEPGFLLLRLTDTSGEEMMTTSPQQTQQQIDSKNATISATPTIIPPQAAAAAAAAAAAIAVQQKVNASPIGLFSFSMVLAIHNAISLIKVGNVGSSFQLMYAPYAYWIGGFLQLLTGIFELMRNNIYGGVAFSCFGGFWLANGTKELLTTYFAVGQLADPEIGIYTDADKWGIFILEVYVVLFVCVLFKQTMIMNKLSSLVIVTLFCNQVSGIVAIWYETALYVNIAFGFLTSLVGFYLFTAEFTNIVYNREVFNLYKWSEDHSPQEVFGAPGNTTNTLLSKAAKLRLAASAHRK